MLFLHSLSELFSALRDANKSTLYFIPSGGKFTRAGTSWARVNGELARRKAIAAERETVTECCPCDGFPGRDPPPLMGLSYARRAGVAQHPSGDSMLNCKYYSAAILLWSAFFCMDFACSQQFQPVPAELDNLRRRMEILNAPASADPRGKGSSLQIETQTRGLWSALKPGMTEGEVQNLLGKPDRIEDQAQTTRWYWNKGETSGGWVLFDHESRKVVAWGSL